MKLILKDFSDSEYKKIAVDTFANNARRGIGVIIIKNEEIIGTVVFIIGTSCIIQNKSVEELVDPVIELFNKKNYLQEIITSQNKPYYFEDSVSC